MANDKLSQAMADLKVCINRYRIDDPQAFASKSATKNGGRARALMDACAATVDLYDELPEAPTKLRHWTTMPDIEGWFWLRGTIHYGEYSTDALVDQTIVEVKGYEADLDISLTGEMYGPIPNPFKQREKIDSDKDEIERIAEVSCAFAYDERNGRFDGEAINWGDLHCVEVGTMDDGYYVIIEEASPTSHLLCQFIQEELAEAGYKNVRVMAEW